MLFSMSATVSGDSSERVQYAHSPLRHTKKIQRLHVKSPAIIMFLCKMAWRWLHILHFRGVIKCMYNVTSWCVRIFTVLKAGICGHSPAEIVGLNPAGTMDVSFECCVLSGRGLHLGLITRPEGTYLVGRVQSVWSRSPIRGGHDSKWGRNAAGGKKTSSHFAEKRKRYKRGYEISTDRNRSDAFA